MKLPSPIISSIEIAINNALKLDNHSFKSVTQLQGKVIKIQFLVVDVAFYLVPTADGMQVLADWEGEPDTEICGSPMAMLRTALSDNRQTLLQGDVKIIGDTDLGQKVQKILNQIDPDWEEPLSKIFGDVAGHQMGEFARSLGNFAKSAFNSLAMTGSEYVQEESRAVVTSTELERFADGVDSVRADTDRMQLRVERLQQKLKEQLS